MPGFGGMEERSILPCCMLGCEESRSVHLAPQLPSLQPLNKWETKHLPQISKWLIVTMNHGSRQGCKTNWKLYTLIGVWIDLNLTWLVCKLMLWLGSFVKCEVSSLKGRTTLDYIPVQPSSQWGESHLWGKKNLGSFHETLQKAVIPYYVQWAWLIAERGWAVLKWSFLKQGMHCPPLVGVTQWVICTVSKKCCYASCWRCSGQLAEWCIWCEYIFFAPS